MPRHQRPLSGGCAEYHARRSAHADRNGTIRKWLCLTLTLRDRRCRWNQPCIKRTCRAGATECARSFHFVSHERSRALWDNTTLGLAREHDRPGQRMSSSALQLCGQGHTGKHIFEGGGSAEAEHNGVVIPGKQRFGVQRLLVQLQAPVQCIVSWADLW